MFASEAFETKSKKSPEELMEIPNLISWLEKQPFYRTYFYYDSYDCLLAKYFKANGYPKVSVSGLAVWASEDDGNCVICDDMHHIIYGGTSIFGLRFMRGALKRARKIQYANMMLNWYDEASAHKVAVTNAA